MFDKNIELVFKKKVNNRKKQVSSIAPKKQHCGKDLLVNVNDHDFSLRDIEGLSNLKVIRKYRQLKSFFFISFEIEASLESLKNLEKQSHECIDNLRLVIPSRYINVDNVMEIEAITLFDHYVVSFLVPNCYYEENKELVNEYGDFLIEKIKKPVKSKPETVKSIEEKPVKPVVAKKNIEPKEKLVQPTELKDILMGLHFLEHIEQEFTYKAKTKDDDKKIPFIATQKRAEKGLTFVASVQYDTQRSKADIDFIEAYLEHNLKKIMQGCSLSISDFIVERCYMSDKVVFSLLIGLGSEVTKTKAIIEEFAETYVMEIPKLIHDADAPYYMSSNKLTFNISDTVTSARYALSEIKELKLKQDELLELGDFESVKNIQNKIELLKQEFAIK